MLLQSTRQSQRSTPPYEQMPEECCWDAGTLGHHISGNHDMGGRERWPWLLVWPMRQAVEWWCVLGFTGREQRAEGRGVDVQSSVAIPLE